jgi:transcription-repair coupling factor (superfamily II helicase)
MTAHTTFFQQLATLPTGKKHIAPTLIGASDAWFIAQLALANQAANQAAKNKSKKLTVMITPNAVDIARLHSEIGFFAPALSVKMFPDWETLPFDNFSPHQDLVSDRLEALYHVLAGDCDVLLLGAATALQRIAPADYVAGRTLFFKQGTQLNAEALKNQLQIAGYSPVTQVMVPGEYAVRGGLIDLFPTGSALPYRLDLFGDEIDSIKTFDVDTQRTLYPVNEVRLLPGREFPFDEAARTYFRTRFREVFEGDPSRSPLYKDAGNGIAHAGIEYYLPLFFATTATLFSYIKSDTLLILPEGLDDAMRSFTRDANERYRFLKEDSEKPILPVADLYLNNEEFFILAQSYARVVLSGNAPERPSTVPPPDVAVQRKLADPFLALKTALIQQPNRAFLIVAESAGRRETMLQSLAEQGLQPVELENFAAFIEFSRASAQNATCADSAPQLASKNTARGVLSTSTENFAITSGNLSSGFTLLNWAEEAAEGDNTHPFSFCVLTEAELYAHSPRKHGSNGHKGGT